MRFLVLAHDKLDPVSAKTANALLRYSRLGWSGRYAKGHPDVPVPSEVVAVVDRSRAGTDAGDVMGPEAQGVPVVASVADGLRYNPDALAIGIAPVGGALPADWRRDLETALENGLHVVSGLHTFLGDDAALAGKARERGARIHDARRFPRARYRIATGEGALVDALVVLTVGTDCGSGKMTTAIELARAALDQGLDAGFVATGQTGLMVGCDAGAPVDAVVSDFVAGVTEKSVMDVAAQGKKIIFVEGQGSITHPAYSAVTCGLLHGSFPDLMVMSHEPTRASLKFPSALKFRTNPLPVEIDLNERLLAPVARGKVAALSLVTRSHPEPDAAIEEAEKETGLPAGDVFRGGAGKILDAVLAQAEEMGLWKNGAPVPGEKAARRGAAPTDRSLTRWAGEGGAPPDREA